MLTENYDGEKLVFAEPSLARGRAVALILCTGAEMSPDTRGDGLCPDTRGDGPCPDTRYWPSHDMMTIPLFMTKIIHKSQLDVTHPAQLLLKLDITVKTH